MKTLLIAAAVVALGTGIALAQDNSTAPASGNPGPVTTPSTPSPTVNLPSDTSKKAKMMHRSHHMKRHMRMHHKSM